MAKPTKEPKWATSDQVDPVSGMDNVIDPTTAQEDYGYTYKDYPSRQIWNYLFRWIYNWLKYFETETDNPGVSGDSGLGTAAGKDYGTDVGKLPENTEALALNKGAYRKRVIAYQFTKTVATSTVYLFTTAAADGIPLPEAGTVVKLKVWDGTSVFTASLNPENFAEGDTLNLLFAWGGSNFGCNIVKNGATSAMGIASGIAGSVTLYITVEYQYTD